jgi:4-hydroxybenzoate polyprenyltransferase
MCLTASGIYCLNDIVDVEENRQHPEKRNRPVANGKISKLHAGILSFVLILLGLLLTLAVYPMDDAIRLCGILGGYIVINLGYSLKIKQIAIADVLLIAIGFVLRITLGGVACSIWISPWLVCMTFLLALFLGFSKRRDDVLQSAIDGESHRKSVSSYNMLFVNQILSMLGATIIVCYILYTVQPEVVARFQCSYVYLTSVFVVAGIIRYLQLAYVKDKSGSPVEILLHDKFIPICIICWIVSFIIIIYK